MWQRIQTVWWIVGILSALAILIFSFMMLDVIPFLLWIMVGFSVLIIVLNLFSISNFKNRNLQKNISFLSVIISLAAIIVQVFFVDIKTLQQYENLYLIVPSVMLLINIICQFLAIKGVNNDVKLLKSMDRLR